MVYRHASQGVGINDQRLALLWEKRKPIALVVSHALPKVLGFSNFVNLPSWMSRDIQPTLTFRQEFHRGGISNRDSDGFLAVDKIPPAHRRSFRRLKIPG